MLKLEGTDLIFESGLTDKPESLEENKVQFLDVDSVIQNMMRAGFEPLLSKSSGPRCDVT